ncbi:MAG: hypothetical protein JWN64_123 [Parcubacteria group bacterium]|nr:hypothetical protein [Parcubacteria group bacterium]
MGRIAIGILGLGMMAAGVGVLFAMFAITRGFLQNSSQLAVLDLSDITLLLLVCVGFLVVFLYGGWKIVSAVLLRRTHPGAEWH